MAHVSVENVTSRPVTNQTSRQAEEWEDLTQLMRHLQQAAGAALGSASAVAVTINTCLATSHPQEWRIHLPGLIRYPNRTPEIHAALADLLAIAAMRYIEDHMYLIKVIVYTSHEPPLDADQQPIGISSLTSRWHSGCDLQNELYNTGELLHQCQTVWPLLLPVSTADDMTEVGRWLEWRQAALERMLTPSG